MTLFDAAGGIDLIERAQKTTVRAGRTVAHHAWTGSAGIRNLATASMPNSAIRNASINLSNPASLKLRRIRHPPSRGRRDAQSASPNSPARGAFLRAFSSFSEVVKVTSAWPAMTRSFREFRPARKKLCAFLRKKAPRQIH